MEAKIYKYKGDDLTLKEIGKITNIKVTTLRSRLRKGWSIDKSTSTKIGPNAGGELSKGQIDKSHSKRRKNKLTCFATCRYRTNAK